jgi:hypothetical protein
MNEQPVARLNELDGIAERSRPAGFAGVSARSEELIRPCQDGSIAQRGPAVTPEVIVGEPGGL